MTLTVTNRGSNTHNTGAASFTLSPATNCTAGATLVLCVAADNSSAAGATNDFTTVTDSLGNTWTKRQAPVFDNGAASAGVQGAIYTTYQDVGAVQTGTIITVNFGSSPVAKTWTLTEVAPSSGSRAEFRTGGDKAAGATGTAMTLGASQTVVVGEVIVAALFMESGTTQSVSAADTDVTNGSWTTNQYAEIGSTTSGSCIISQAKVQTTADSAQTYDVTMGISSDYTGSYVILRDVINVAPTEAVAASNGQTPGVTLGAITATPTQAVAASNGQTPGVTLGAITITPTEAVAASNGQTPGITFGAITATPTEAVAASNGQALGVTLGELVATPIQAVAAATAAAPTVDNSGGNQNITPIEAVAASNGQTPGVTLGAITVTLTEAVAASNGQSLGVTLGELAVTPASAVAGSNGQALGITLGAITATPTQAVAAATAANPDWTNGLTVVPIEAVAVGSGQAPNVVLGELVVAPAPAGASASGAAPGVALGELAVTPSPAVASALALDPGVVNAGNQFIGFGAVVAAATAWSARARNVTSMNARVTVTGNTTTEVDSAGVTDNQTTVIVGGTDATVDVT